jgi:GNAT superfamily N-acetyltransferase
MTTRGLARLPSSALRVGNWQGHHDIALVAPAYAGPPVEPGDVDGCLTTLRQRGYREVYTAAMGIVEQQAFLASGFELHERLHLLEHDLRQLPPVPQVPWAPRRHRRGELQQVLAVDQAAFDDFWRFDARALREARHATPTSRLRVVGEPECLGYAVFGRAQSRGYLQRLAVRPDATGRGLGTALIVDGLSWLRRHGADHAVVNTQESNIRAFELYRRLGFRPQLVGLSVLHRVIDDPARP